MVLLSTNILSSVNGSNQDKTKNASSEDNTVSSTKEEDLNEDHTPNVQEEIDQTLRESGFTEEEIAQIRQSVQNPSGAKKNKGYKVAHEAIDMANELIEDVNNMHRLKTGTAEAELLDDVLSMEMGDSLIQEPTEEEKAEIAEQERLDSVPMTPEQKQQLADLEAELDEIEDGDFDLVDL